ncbi:MAG: hypothetical protein AAGJ83_11790 [Planctomycetota bacterium]
MNDSQTDFPDDHVIDSGHSSLRVSRFDSVTWGLVSVIVFLGCLVSMMFVMWLATGEPKLLVQPMPIAKQSGATGSIVSEPEFEQPTAKEIEDLVEPAIKHTIEALTNAVSTVAMSVQWSSGQTDETSDGGGGTSRSKGSEPGNQIVPRWQRWELRFSATDKDDYARQLDHHGIELAAFGGTGPNVIEMATDLASQPRRKINENPETEKRLYFSWLYSNPLLKFDQQILRSVGISSAGRNVVRFVSAELETQLLRLERQHCLSNGKTFPDSISKTVFESRRGEDGYEFTVIKQRYR